MAPHQGSRSPYSKSMFPGNALGDVQTLPVEQVVGAYIGFFLMGCVLIGMGIFISSLTDNQLVATIVEEDVAFGPENIGVPPAEIRQRVDDALRSVGMYEFREHAPHQLSGGQKQRIAIAGVIAMRPRCIVLDEPTAMLDPRGRVEVLSTIREMNKQYGITVVLITHYMDEAAQCDRVVVVDDGKIILDGTAREVFTHVQLLKSRGLDVPQSTDLANDLADAGYSIDRSILGEEECADALAALLEAHGIHSTKQAEEA